MLPIQKRASPLWASPLCIRNTIPNAMCSTRLFIIILGITFVNTKIFNTRCKLVRELIKVGSPNDMFLGHWVCLIEQVSKRNTSAYVVTPSGKKFYGIYQIPSRWCKEGKRGGDCNIKCELLLDDNIRDDTECAVKILNREGFKYWPKWTDRCKDKIKFITEEIYKCPDLSSPRSSPDRTSSRYPLRAKRGVPIRKRRWRLLNFYSNMGKH